MKGCEPGRGRRIITLCLYAGICCLLLTPSTSEAETTPKSPRPGRIDNVCGLSNGHKLYIDLGERGVLRAFNVSGRAVVSGAPQPSHSQCSLEVVTCPSCVINLEFRQLSLPSYSQDLSCRGDYVWVTEPPFEASGTPFCGTGKPKYRSQTRTVNVAFFFSTSHLQAFVIEYQADYNRQILGMNPNKAPADSWSNNSNGGVLNSPFFPALYPRDMGAEYVIKAVESNARVQLLFSDFQLATSSIMEFYDWNGQRIDLTSGSSARPPVITSSGHTLMVRLYANGGTGLGFRAAYTFFTEDSNSSNSSLHPITDCGGTVENSGGAITMLHMTDKEIKHYDCIWLIKPPRTRNFFHLKTYLYLKIEQFSDFGGITELVVRQGSTSQGAALETLRSPLIDRPHKELVRPIDVGFYIALRGVFTPTSKLAIAYAAFSYQDCFAGSDVVCKNHRCISSVLTCDGFDHCGDGSDESGTCFQGWNGEALNRKWHAATSNYFFPKMERYPDLKTATLVFLISSLGLIFLIMALMVLLYRMGARARQQCDLQNRLQTISEILDGSRLDEIAPDEPPTYEAPPDYEEVIKVASSSATTSVASIPGPSVMGHQNAPEGGRIRAKVKSRRHERRRAKSSPGACINPSSSVQELALRVSLPPAADDPPSLPYDVNQRALWHDNQGGGSAPILLLNRSRQSGSPVPNSPPPPYAINSTLSGALVNSLPAIQQRRDSIQPLLFEDNFSSVTEGEDLAEPLQEVPPPPCVGSVMCKLASPEHFDDALGTSVEDQLVQLEHECSRLRDLARFDLQQHLAPGDINCSSDPLASQSLDPETTTSGNRHRSKTKAAGNSQSLSNSPRGASGAAGYLLRHGSVPQLDEHMTLLTNFGDNDQLSDLQSQTRFLKAQILEDRAKLLQNIPCESSSKPPSLQDITIIIGEGEADALIDRRADKENLVIERPVFT